MESSFTTLPNTSNTSIENEDEYSIDYQLNLLRLNEELNISNNKNNLNNINNNNVPIKIVPNSNLTATVTTPNTNTTSTTTTTIKTPDNNNNNFFSFFKNMFNSSNTDVNTIQQQQQQQQNLNTITTTAAAATTSINGDIENKELSSTTLQNTKSTTITTPTTNTITTTTTTTTTTAITPQDESWFGSFFQNLNSRIKELFISPETEEALSHINCLIEKFFSDVPHSKFNILVGLFVLDNFYSNSHVTSGSLVSNREFIETAGYYMKFASASFGWKYIYGYLYKKKVKGFMKGVASGDSLNEIVLCEHTGIARQDIIAHKWTSTNFDPGHYLAFDHKNRAIVLSIRGTFHARDILTDLVATSTPFLEGFAHTGILRCAQKKFNELSPIILEQLEMKKGYKFIVVGHSLGGGVASLFTMIFKDKYPDIPIHCYSFASPCITSMEIALSHKYTSLIDTFVFNNDVVPRLCYASLEHLKKLVCKLVEKNDNIFRIVFLILATGNTFGEPLTNKIANFLKCNTDIKFDTTPTLNDSSMFPAGKIYRMYHLPKEGYVMEESNASLFGEIIISNTLLSDHMPDQYEMGFESCLHVLNDSVFPTIEVKDNDIVLLHDYIPPNELEDEDDDDNILEHNENEPLIATTTTTTTSTTTATAPTTTITKPQIIFENDQQTTTTTTILKNPKSYDINDIDEDDDDIDDFNFISATPDRKSPQLLSTSPRPLTPSPQIMSSSPRPLTPLPIPTFNHHPHLNSKVVINEDVSEKIIIDQDGASKDKEDQDESTTVGEIGNDIETQSPSTTN
eukprot:gene7498-9214_t